MQDNTVSWSARYASASRAAHQVLDDVPGIIEDPIVVGLITGTSRREILAREEIHRQPLHQLVRTILALRSRFAEDQLKQRVEQGIRQYVILGAGLDTFAYRQPDWAKKIRIIELDHPASQAFKRMCLLKAHIIPPKNVIYCPVDFEQTTLRLGLETVDLLPRSATFFSWLGCSQYITPSAIAATFDGIAGFPAGSGIAFSFILEEMLLSGVDKQACDFFSAMMRQQGEPWLTRFDPAALRGQLLQHGFSLVRQLSPEQLNRRYLSDRKDGLTAPVFEQLMYAQV